MSVQYKLNKELAQMLKGGVIMDVTTPEQAKIAEAAGACAVMALERIPADIRAAGGVSRMSDPKMIRGIQEAVSIPVMAKCRIGHFVEAQVLEAIEIDYIDESEVLSPADDVYHIDKTQFKVPFVCGARDLGEALRRIAEGAAMIRTKGEPGTGDVVQAVRHMRAMNAEIRRVQNLREDELFETAKQLQVPVELLRSVHENGRLPVVNFAAGGVAQIDMFGVGERLITAKSEPVFGGVYKLVAVERPDGTIEPKIKISENVGKITNPHFKKLYRFYGADTGKAIADYLCLHDEIVNDGEDLEIFDPEATWKRKKVYNFHARELQVPVFRNGELVYQLPTLNEIRSYCREQVDTLWDEVKRFDNPHTYYVDLSQKLWEIKYRLLKDNACGEHHA